ncbi:Sir2 silent information regulator family NAD-dependent deacetylase [Streptococcus pluranimalium]|uniref:Sir2 silent information regulator family NAD-dependent deacetylase n=1 Tax=Streptococcus pluranimalium TaxID=82348 RepID=UPI0039FD3A7D
MGDIERQAISAIQDADTILIGAGAGFSAAAGLTYSGSRFEKHFEKFIATYGLSDMYSAGFYPYPTPEAEWAYWAKHIYHNRYEDGPLPLYENLFRLVKDKDYFVITTNVDGQFMKAGFDPHRFFEVQGNYGEFQCSVPCKPLVYDNKDQVLKMLMATNANLEIPSQLLPVCPNCGAPLTRHLRIDHGFVQDETWYRQQKHYASFLEGLQDRKVILLELGVGYNTPTIIRYPFENLTYHLPQAKLLRFNQTDTEGVKENAHKTMTITKDIGEVMTSWL